MKTKCWKQKLQSVYSSFDEFCHYGQMYGLAKRLGYPTCAEAWHDNPLIQGSCNPADYKVVKGPPTKVIFRQWRAQPKTVIAIFPEELGDSSPYTCMCYEHVGQHGAGTPDEIIIQTIPAKQRDKEILTKELVSLGYNLKELKRYSYRFLAIRRAKIEESEKQFIKSLS